jgi:DNA-binding response OmpR family regulator
MWRRTGRFFSPGDVAATNDDGERTVPVASLLLLTDTSGTSFEVLPSLALLAHVVRVLPLEAAPLLDAPPSDVILLDARRELAAARQTCRVLRSTGSAPLIAVVTEGGLAAVAADWGLDDVVVDTAGPAEVEARLRLAIGRTLAERETSPSTSEEIRSGDLSIDEATYQARLGNEALDLTFKEFELLKFLAQHPGRVFTRAQLLQEVWGYDYFGGTRTVDVHVRRLRAKLGPDRESLIGTVRNVGYKFVAQQLSPLPPLGSEVAAEATQDTELTTQF